MKILVVDDELDICEILQYNLETEGYEVAAVNSAEEALTLDLTEYALILLDVMMENMSGFQMAHKMKENPATAQIPIIFITALDGENHMVKGLNIGADDYIVRQGSMRCSGGYIRMGCETGCPRQTRYVMRVLCLI